MDILRANKHQMAELCTVPTDTNRRTIEYWRERSNIRVRLVVMLVRWQQISVV